MKYVKYFFIVLISIFSFYTTDKLLIYVENMNPIMQTIYEVEEKYEEKSVDAIIENNTIIPGKNGKTVNERESYLKMKEFKKFNETFLVYDELKPKISLYDNLDKIIIKGNKKNKISLIVNNEKIENYLNENNINYNKIIYSKEEIKNKNVEYIGIDLKLKNKICLIGYSNINECIKNKYFIINPTLEINNYNYLKINNIEENSFILITNDLSFNKFKILYSKIKSNNWDIIKISKIIKE